MKQTFGRRSVRMYICSAFEHEFKSVFFGMFGLPGPSSPKAVGVIQGRELASECVGLVAEQRVVKPQIWGWKLELAFGLQY